MSPTNGVDCGAGRRRQTTILLAGLLAGAAAGVTFAPGTATAAAVVFPLVGLAGLSTLWSP